jgi:PmbA protein
MNKEIQELTAWAIKTAKAAGANDCKVSIGSQRNVEISYRQHKPENIKEATTKQLYIQVFVNGRYSSQTTSDLRKDALKDFIGNAIAVTKLLAEDPYRSLPDPKYYKGRKETDLGTVDPQHAKFTPEDRHNLVKAIENAALEKGGDKVISVTAEENDGYSESITMTSNSFEGYEEDTFYVAT